jgi:hypothetical protein
MQHSDDADLTQGEIRDLRFLAGSMIPASAEYGVPGADDDTIFADLLSSLGRDRPQVRLVLAGLATRAGATFAELPPAQRTVVAASLHARAGDEATTLHRLVLLCYYRDDRVMRALNMEPRPPFPRGFDVEQGDWSLLDPVRARPRLWRDPA